MPDETKPQPEATGAAAAEAVAETAESAPETDAGPSEAEQLAAEVADLRDRLLRAAAEMENTRKRAEREIADARTYAVSAFATDIVSIGDNLRRAIDAVPAAAKAEAGPVATLSEGVEMTDRELLRVLEKHGVRRIDPKGEPFDPHRHQAIFEVPTADSAPGTVVQVVQAGYLLKDRVLRPALVGVAKAAPPPPPAEPKDDGAQKELAEAGTSDSDG